MIEVINPKDEQDWLEQRTKDITSTEVSALFGLSPYSTAFELWHHKKSGVVVRLNPNERMEWGTALQDAIASHIGKKQGWEIRRMNEYLRDPELRAGSSFDFSIKTSDVENPYGLLEIKNVDGLVFKNEWTEDDNGDIQAPLHIEIQVQHELFVSDRKYCYLGALIGGNRLELVKRTRDEAVIQAIKEKVAEFWVSINENKPPEPNLEADADFIGKLFGYAAPGKVLDISEDTEMTKQAQEYKRLGDIAKDCETKREAIKAWFLTRIEDAEKCLGVGFSIDCGVTGPAHVEYDRQAFRRFKINWKKVK